MGFTFLILSNLRRTMLLPNPTYPFFVENLAHPFFKHLVMSGFQVLNLYRFYSVQIILPDFCCLQFGLSLPKSVSHLIEIYYILLNQFLIEAKFAVSIPCIP